MTEPLTAEALNDLRKEILEGKEVDRARLKQAIEQTVGMRLEAWKAMQEKASKPKKKTTAKKIKKLDLDSLL